MFEGRTTIESSFNVLGQVAGRKLFPGPSVTQQCFLLNPLYRQEKMDELSNSVH